MLLAAKERVELGTDEYIPLTSVLEQRRQRVVTECFKLLSPSSFAPLSTVSCCSLLVVFVCVCLCGGVSTCAPNDAGVRMYAVVVVWDKKGHREQQHHAKDLHFQCGGMQLLGQLDGSVNGVHLPLRDGVYVLDGF